MDGIITRITEEDFGMLGDTDAMATIAVDDLAKARRFYEGKLGRKVSERREGVLNFTSGRLSRLP